MLTYKEYMKLVLNEGIIKIDKQLLNFMEACFIVDFVELATKQITRPEVTKLLNEIKQDYYDSYLAYMKENNIKKVDKTYLGLIYDNGIYNKFNYHVGTKSLDEYNGASFHRGSNGSLDSIKVAFDKDFVSKFNSILGNPTKNKILNLFKEKKNQIEHELAHLVEWSLMTKKIKKAKKNYDTNEEDYFTSDIEFEPMILSLVRNFELMVKNYKINNGRTMKVEEYKNLAKDILKAEQYNELDNVFMLHTKNITPVKYRKAVKKAYVEIIDNIDTLKQEGYLE